MWIQFWIWTIIYRSFHHTTEAVLVSLRYRAELQGSLAALFHWKKNNHNVETLYVSIKMSNFQVKKTYETALGTALARHRLHSHGLIKCFGLLPTLVRRYFGLFSFLDENCNPTQFSLTQQVSVLCTLVYWPFIYRPEVLANILFDKHTLYNYITL